MTQSFLSCPPCWALAPFCVPWAQSLQPALLGAEAEILLFASLHVAELSSLQLHLWGGSSRLVQGCRHLLLHQQELSDRSKDSSGIKELLRIWMWAHFFSLRDTKRTCGLQFPRSRGRGSRATGPASVALVECPCFAFLNNSSVSLRVKGKAGCRVCFLDAKG